MAKAKVVVIDDDPVVLRAVTEILRRDGHEVTSLADPVEALAVVRDATIDVVVTDIKMPNVSGLEVLKAFKQAQPEVEVIIMTGHATVETALEAVRAGAYDYLTKPFERIEDFSLAVNRAIEHRQLKQRTQVLEQTLSSRTEFEGIIGQSAQMQAVFKLIDTVSRSAATVLIQGESGTGKERVARAIHFRSPRAAKPFIAVNCSALTDTLLDSELFGHVKGAFTGAVAHKRGLFEAANEGTLFLDEIGDIPQATQVRLLRALQEGEVKRVGSNDVLTVDVRVVAATNVDLKKAMQDGRFREDLFYRLNVIGLTLPALRERPEDVPLLARHFAAHYASKLGKKLEGISAGTMKALTTYGWPGNVRELENVIERAVVLTTGQRISAEDLPAELKASRAASAQSDVTTLAHLPFAQAKALTIAAFERRYLAATLEKTRNNVTQAAVAAGMDRSNFRRLLREHSMLPSRAGGGAESDVD